MACGVPVVAANRAALAEIAGGHALMVDDLTVEAFAEAMARVLGDRALHAELSAKCRERARAFRWKETAQRTLDVVRQVARA
jgi:glycosyltransferase involved in cell wall biosynthesis